ncbi:MAG: hypothetical protein H7328_01630 [Bdellovibrio sp.]|nr:hypothetical protein [Bdellovibrio sp.]
MKFLATILVFGFTTTALAYPEITDWKSSPLIVFENKSSAPLRKNYLVKSPFFVVTANADEVSLQMTTQSELTVYPKSKVQIPEVHSAAIATYDIFLLNGEIRTRHSGESADQKRNQIKTVFFDLEQPKDADAMIYLDMKEPSVEVRMIRGEWLLEFFAYEKKQTLKAGEKIKFVGVFAADGNGLKYDYLLDNRKIPQGKLGAVQKFEIQQFFDKEKAIRQSILDKKNAFKKNEDDKIKKRKAYEDSFLCKKPFAQKDQCAWWIDGDKCFRKRCNVSGKWGDIVERPLNLEPKCTKDFNVADCDY